MGTNSNDEDDFFKSGPSHLTSIDWNNEDHCRTVAACLVQSVYLLENDDKTLAEPWWKTFHFEKYDELKDIEKHKSSIFGAVYKFKRPLASTNGDNNHSIQKAPSCVIALRGTNTSSVYDLKLDLLLVLGNNLHQTSRTDTALKKVREMINEFGDASNIWLTGHSLGASIAMQIGKNMAKEDNLLQAYLFNPPFIYLPIENLGMDEKQTQGARLLRDFLSAGLTLATTTSLQRTTSENAFVELSPWIPRLFVNIKDPICEGYIYYFEDMRKEQQKPVTRTIKNISCYSTGINSFYNHFLKKESQASHVLPSAKLFKNLGSEDVYPHGLSQWWSLDLNLDSQEYKYTES